MATLKKVRAGMPLEIPADTFNAFVDAAQDLRNRRVSAQGGPIADKNRSGGIILVRNTSGTDRSRFDILGVDGPIITPTASASAFAEQIALDGVTPTDDHAGRFVVLAEPIRDGYIGRAWVHGTFVVRVNVADEEHTTADVDASDPTALLTSDSGSVTLLWVQPEADRTTAGVAWAIARFGGGASGTGTSAPASFPALLTTVRRQSSTNSDLPIYGWEEAEIDADGVAAAKPGGATSDNGKDYVVAEETINDAGGTDMTAPADEAHHAGTITSDETTVTISWGSVPSANEYWVYIGTAAPVDPESAGGSDIYDSGALSSATLTVDATSVPTDAISYVTIWWKIGATYYWNRWSLDFTDSLDRYAVNLEDVNRIELATQSGLAGMTEIADGGEDDATDLEAPILVHLCEIGGRYVFYLADPEFYGLVTDAGPSAEADYTDNRYWVTLGKPKTTSGALTVEVEIDAVTGDRAKIVTVTNLAEAVDATHELDVGTPVIVRQVRAPDKPWITRFVMSAGGAGSLTLDDVFLYVKYVESTAWDADNCEIDETYKWLVFERVTIGGEYRYLLKEVSATDPEA